MEILDFFAGILFGIITGLIPGLHPNTVCSVLSQLYIPDEMKSALIIGMIPANIVASFIPAIFFGIPEHGTVIAALAGQRLTLAGRGLTALKAVLFSIGVAVFAAFVLFIPSMEIFPFAYELIGDYIKYIVLVLAVIVIIKSRNPLLSLLVFLAAGLLGYFSLNSGMQDPFMPLFSGMFAISALLNITKSKIPKQKDEGKIRMELVAYALLGVFLGMAADLLPGISSPSQVALFAGIVVPMNSLGYMATIGSIGISEAIFSLSTSASIDKSRMGSTVWLSKFIDIEENAFLLASFFLLGTVISLGVIYLFRKKIAMVSVFNSKPIAVLLIAYLGIISFLLNGWLGIVVLLLSSGLGWVTLRLGVERIQMMGAVIVPTLLLLFGIFLL